MSDKLPVISGKELVALLEKLGFVIVRIKGSHHRMKHSDGRIATVPVHKNDSLPKVVEENNKGRYCCFN
jgi:predicted RNA binding protein YcfA (HicA-like mRNA interferase family)